MCFPLDCRLVKEETEMIRITIVEDEPESREQLIRYLRRYEELFRNCLGVVPFSSRKARIRWLQSQNPVS